MCPVPVCLNRWYYRACSHERSEVTDEMARDEARHGKALKGLLERYFK